MIYLSLLCGRPEVLHLNECDLKWMWSQMKWSQMNVVSNECSLKWMWSQMNVVSNECGLKWTGLKLTWSRMNVVSNVVVSIVMEPSKIDAVWRNLRTCNIPFIGAAIPHAFSTSAKLYWLMWQIVCVWLLHFILNINSKPIKMPRCFCLFAWCFRLEHSPWLIIILSLGRDWHWHIFTFLAVLVQEVIWDTDFKRCCMFTC